MTRHRHINPWHLLSLALAFVAGGAVFTNPTWFPGTSTGSEASVTDNAASDTEAAATAGNGKSDLAGTEVQATDVVALPAPVDIPLYLQNELEDLREQSEIARDQIDELERTVFELSRDIESGIDASDQISAVPGEGSAPAVPAAGNANRGRRDRGINRDALVQAGVDGSVIDLIQQRQDQQALARLNLLDRAAREGYSGTERLENELDELRDSTPDLREELGDAAYDQYLYNAGSTNRVRVSTIISGSIAELAGVQLGDIIFQYGSTRVFNTRELVSAIREGVRDEPVLVSIVREGQPLVLDVTRAPLGVTLSGVRVEPDF